ncbi:MAG: OPT/YSL family transporter [Planctomycetota bacterium]
MPDNNDTNIPPTEGTTPGAPAQGTDAGLGTGPIDLEPSSVPPGTTAPASFTGAKPYREVTLSAIILGLIIGLVMNASITYAGLKIGFTIVGSAIAAVLGFGILKLLKGGTIVETNITQTVASGVNTANSGVIFTFPVLFLLGFTIDWSSLDFWLIALAGVAGAVMGCAFIIPLRKQMIDIDRLRFPSAVGVATILKSPGAGLKKAFVLLAGITLGALIYLPTGLPGLPLTADLDELDRLVEIERITQDDADRTELITSWIETQTAPEDVLARGDLLYQLEQARKDEQAARDERASLRSAETDDTAANDEVERVCSVIKDLEAQLEVSPLENVPDPLALTTYKVASAVAPDGKTPPQWDDLRDTKLGWAGKAILGYGDLNARLPAHYQQNSNDVILNYDQDQDGDPDRWLTDSTVDVGRLLGLPGEIELIFAIAPFALGAGFITGRAGLYVLAGGILAFFIINPVAYNAGWLPQYLAPHDAPGFMFGSVNRPLGIGMLLGGALMGVLASFPAIREAIKSVATSKGGPGRGKRDEMSLLPVIIAIVAGAGLLFTAADFVGNDPINPECPVTTIEGSACDTQVDTAVEPAAYKGYAIGFASPAAAETWANDWTDADRDAYLETLGAKPGWLAGLDPHLRAAIIAVIGVVWIWFAGIIIAQCTGMTDWSPISGMALLTVVLVLLLAGSGAVVGAVMIGVALCVAITLAADMMADLKTGYLVGAKPIRQQAVELSVVGIGPVISMLVVLLIVSVNMQTVGIPLGPGTETTAPQAQALEAIITSVQGGETPYALYGAGAALGIVLGLGAFSGLGVLVGLSIYLPFIYIATYGIGVVVAMVMAQVKGKRFVEEWGVPFAAGLIVGEAVLALILNIIILITQS